MLDLTTDFNKQVSDSLNSLSKAIEIYPNQTSAYLQKARILLIIGDKESSLGVYKEALKAVKKDITLMNDDKVVLEKLILEELGESGLKSSSLLKDIFIAITFPGNAKAGCIITNYGYNHCTSREDAEKYIEE